MNISNLLRTQIERHDGLGIGNLSQALKTQEETDREPVVALMKDGELNLIQNTNEFRKFTKGIKSRLPGLYNFISTNTRESRTRLILLFNLVSRLPDYFKDYSDDIRLATSIDLACCILSYDYLLDVRECQEASGTLLGEDKYESMKIFISLISDCLDLSTREEFDEFNLNFSQLFALMEAKRRTLSRKRRGSEDGTNHNLFN